MKKALHFTFLLVILVCATPSVSANPSGTATGQFFQKVLQSEMMGEQGARLWAKRQGWNPLYLGKGGIPQGLDQVYRSTDDIIHAIEAKGGSSPLGRGYGYKQGTSEWGVQAAKRMLRSPSSSSRQMKAAQKTLQAAQKGNMKIHTLRSLHTNGTLQKTQLTKTAQTTAMARYLAGGSAMPDTWSQILSWGGIAFSLSDALYRGYRAKQIEDQLDSGEIGPNKRIQKHLTNVTTYLGAWAGWYSGSLVGTQVGTMIYPVTGTVIGSVAFSIGGYMFGYWLLQKATIYVYKHRDQIAGYAIEIGEEGQEWIDVGSRTMSTYYTEMKKDLGQQTEGILEQASQAVPDTQHLKDQSYETLKSGTKNSRKAVQNAGQKVKEYSEQGYSTISDWTKSITSEAEQTEDSGQENADN